MVSAKQWFQAQAYELDFWEAVARHIVRESDRWLTWYRWRADRLIQRLERLRLHRLTSGETHVVEIGSGPIGVCTFFPGRERVAIDPLMDRYSRWSAFSNLRDPRVDYRQGIGERLPCPSGHYDLVIVEHCIEQVQDVRSVMRELARVLRPDGVLYLTVSTRTPVGHVVDGVLSRLFTERGRLHGFTPRRTTDLVRLGGFRPCDIEIGSYLQATRADLPTGQGYGRLKALLGIGEFPVSIIAEHDTAGASARYRQNDGRLQAARAVA